MDIDLLGRTDNALNGMINIVRTICTTEVKHFAYCSSLSDCFTCP
jgi:hypothetical protein